MSKAAQSEPAQAGIGTAHLTSELDDGGPYTISGVAIGADDVTVGSSGIKKKWPGEELKSAAETLSGQPLVRDHQNDTDGRVGTVTDAYYRKGVGVMYEAEIAPHYEDLAQDIAAGIQEVSARAYHDPVEELDEDEDSDALITRNIIFDNLSVVSQGAAPSNTAEIGGLDTSGAVAMAQGPSAGAVATLEQGSPRPTAELAEYGEGDWVKGDSSGGTWHGKVRGMKSDGCYSDKIDGDQEICAGDGTVYLIENYDPESGEFTDTMVAHKESGMSAWDHEENARKEYIDVMAAELESDMSELDEVYSEWSDAVNMTASQLESWADHPCSDEASRDPEAVRERNMHLLETNKSDWGSDEIEDAKRTISFISRMSDEENEPESPKDGPNGCPSEWSISLLNWAHNPFDGMPEVPDEMEEESTYEPDHGDTDELMDINYTAADGAVWFEVPDPETTVTSPVQFVTGAHGFKVEAVENGPQQGHGHLHVLVNQDYVEAGEMIPEEEGYVHLIRGQKKFELDLPAGEHTIRLQAGDANHMAYDMRDRVDVEVIAPDGSSESSDTEENAMHGPMHDTEDRTTMPRAKTNDTPEWEEGDMVRWQVEPDLFGKIVHVDEEKYVAMVEVMAMEGGEMTSSGFTITAGFSDLKPMEVPESKSDMSMHGDKEHEEDMSSGTDGRAIVAELKSVAGVTFEDTMGGDLDESEIPNDDYEQHYLFPEDTKSDSSYPVVDADGNLRKGNVQAAHGLGARGGVSDSELTEKLMALNKEWPEGERPIDSDGSEENSAARRDDDAPIGQSTLTVAALSEHHNNTNETTMTKTLDYDRATEDDIEDEMSDPVVMEHDDVEELREKADEADELSESLDKVNSSIDELAANQEKLEDVDEERLDELREYDEAVVLTDAEHDELQGLVDEIGAIFADELADYSPFESEELQERFTPLELRDKVSEHEDASVASELGASETDPEPEGGSASPEELEQSDKDARTEATEEQIRESVAKDLEAGSLHRQAEKVREGEISLEEMGIDVSEALAD